MDDYNIDQYLSVLLSSEALEKIFIAAEALDNISAVFHRDLSTVEACFYTAKALDPAEGILKYVGTVAVDRRIPCKEAYHLIEYIVVNLPAAAELLSSQLMSWCIQFLKRDTLNEAKSNVIKVAHAIVRSCPCLYVEWGSVIFELKTYLTNEKKIPPTLRESIYSLFGAICELRPEVATSHQEWFFIEICRSFDEYRYSKNVSDVLVEACFNGLHGLLVHFPPPDPKTAQLVYKNLKQSCALNQEFRMRNTVARSAIKLFSKHAAHFDQLIYNDYLEWHCKLAIWITVRQASEQKQLGIVGLATFYRIIARWLKSESPDNGNQVFQSLKEHFSRPLHGQNIYAYQDVLSGVSELSFAYLKYSSEEELLAAIGVAMAAEDNPSLLGMQLEAVSKVLCVLPTRQDRSSLSRLAVSLVESFPKIEDYFKPHALSALENSVCSWLEMGDCAMHVDLATLMYQGLLRSSAFPILADVQLLEQTEKLVSYQDFVPLWTHLLTIRSRSSGAGNIVYDAFVSNLLKIVTKLDLNVVVLTCDRSDPSAAMDAKSPHDFQIFVNLVDLFQEVIPVAGSFHLLKWLPELLQECVRRSRSCPLVSGFYKIIATCFQVAPPEDIESSAELVELMVDFLNEVMKRINSQKEDLLIASLRMLLLAPVAVMKPLCHQLGRLMMTAVRVGRGYPDMLALGIDALERWHSQMPLADVQSIIAQVLPHLSAILLSSSAQQTLQATAGAKMSLKTRGKVRKKLIGLSDSKIVTLQKQLILFLAKLDPVMCMTSLQPKPENMVLDGPSLTYRLPLPDAKLNLFLTPLLPRIAELALSSGERSTRITACELLHANLLLAVARTREVNSNPQLMRWLLHAALALSCDSDRVVSDIFNPLVLQITHYFSGQAHLGSGESAALIEVLMESVAHSYDSSLRDFAARCLREYVVWSAKQATPQLLAGAPYNIRGVLRMVGDYAVHPDRCKRLGAAVAFNVLYSVVREDKELMNVYWLQLYHVFLCSLELCTDEEDARLVTAALEHIHRPFLEQQALFMTSPPERRVPPRFRGATLVDVAIRTLDHCQNRSGYLRKLSQSFVKKIISRLSQYSSLGDFIKENGVEVAFDVVDSFDHDGWREHCVAPLDYANWLLKEGVVDLGTLKSNEQLQLYANAATASAPSDQIPTLISFVICCPTPEALENLAKVMHGKLDNAEVNSAFVRLVSSLTQKPELLNLFLSKLPPLSERDLLTGLADRKDKDLTKVLTVFEVMTSAGALNEDYSADRLLISIFEKLFKKRGQKTVCVHFHRQLEHSLRTTVRFATRTDLTTLVAIELITDATQVEDNGRKTTKGDFFFLCFKTELIPFLLNGHETLSHFLQLKVSGLGWMMRILEHARDEGEGRSVTNRFVLRLLDNWRDWVAVVPQRSQLLALLKTAAQVQGASYGCFKDLLPVASWFYSTPDQVNVPAEDIRSFFQLLPQFSSFLEETNTRLERSLAVFERKWLWFGRGDVAARAASFATSKSVFESLLSSFEATGSLVVLKFTSDAIAQNRSVLKEEIVLGVINRIAVHFPAEHVVRIGGVLSTSLLTELVDKESVFAVKPILLEILRAAANNAVVTFFENHICQFLKTLEEKLSDRVSRDIIRKIVATDLIQILYMKTSKAEREKIQLAIAEKEIFKKIVHACAFGRLQIKSATPDEAELLRLFNCSCVNFLCAFATNFPEDKHFTVFLFRKELWESVVDEEKEYNLGMDFAKVPERKSVLTSVKKSKVDMDEAPRPTTAYAQSHGSSLFDSTLSEDVRKFDLSRVLVTSLVTASVPTSATVLDLEMDALNQHEVVPSICALVLHMHHRQLCSWRQFFLDTLKQSSSRNTKLLVLKILYDVDLDLDLDQLSEPYDAQCAPVMLTCIVELFGNAPINYFVIDLINMLVKWHAVLSGEGSQLTMFVKGLVEKPGSLRKEVLKYVFQIARTVVETWKHLLNAAELTAFLLSRIRADTNDETTNNVNLHFASILLANNLIPAHAQSVDALVFWSLKTMKADSKNLQLAAEVCGMALNNLKESEQFSDLYANVCRTLRDLAHSNATSDVLCMYHIHKFYPPVSSSFVSVLMTRAWHDRSALKQHSLELLLSHVTTLGALGDVELTMAFAVFAGDVLKCHMVPAQETMLRIVLEAVDSIQDDTIVKLTSDVIQLSGNANDQLRDLASQILMKIFQRFDGKASSEGIKSIVSTSRVALLKRMNDVNTDIRNKCVDFWCNSKVPKLTVPRLVCVFNELFTPETEEEFVEYACRTLLHAATATPDYQLDLFEHPLTECTYSDVKLLVSWRAQHASLAPMFAPSVTSELGRLDVELPESSSLSLRLRETARSLLFTPTLADAEVSLPSEAPSPADHVFKKPRPPRFHRSVASAQVFFAKRAAETARQEKASALERRRDKDGSVRLYRSYRSGDYPDVLIKHQHFLALLSALVAKDPQFAKLLFIGLFAAIAKDVSEQKQLTSVSSDTFRTQVTDSLNKILKASCGADSVAIGAVFQIALSNQLSLATDDVCRAARSSGLLSTGALLIEMAISNGDYDAQQSKRCRGAGDQGAEKWLRLAQLYYDMKEMDAVRSVFLDQLCVGGTAQKAIEYETLSDWASAAESYEQVLNTDADTPDRRHFYSQSYLACLANLSDWAKLEQCIALSAESSGKTLWGDAWCADVLVPWQARAKLVTSLSEEGSIKFEDYMKKCMQDQPSAQLTSKLSVELAVSHWLSRDVARAMSAVYQALVAFITAWSHVNEWDMQLKKSHLTNLQVLCEIERIVGVLSSQSQSCAVAKMALDASREIPHESSDLVSWDVRLCLRSRFRSFLQSSGNFGENDVSLVAGTMVAAQLSLAQAAVAQGNVHLARKYLIYAKKQGMDLAQETQWKHVRRLAAFFEVKKNEQDPQVKMKNYLNLWQKAEANAAALMETDDKANQTHINRSILVIISEMLALCHTSGIDSKKVSFLPSGQRDLQECWLSTAYNTADGLNDVTSIGQVHVDIAKFHRQHTPGAERWTPVVRALLKAMQCGNSAARELFACILTMEGAEESTELLEESGKVPTWMFLMWRHQLIANLNSMSAVPLVRAIVLRIAQDYPNALSYSLRISKANFTEQLKKQRFVNQLSALVLSNPVEELFVAAIGKLVNPFLKVKYYLDKIYSCLLESNQNWDEIQQLLKDLQNVMRDSETCDNYRPLRAFKSEVDNLAGLKDADALKLAVKNLNNAVGNAKTGFKLSGKLQNFSSWLSEFQGAKTSERLEIPGQYDGLSEPRPGSHAMVASFKQDLLILRSKTQPIKLTIIGNDAREYNFLAKFGEDLRQDERIQQVWGQMQRTLRASKPTAQLQLGTYSVIPLTACWGLIAWVDSAKTLSDLMDIPRQQVEEACGQHLRFLCPSATTPVMAHRRGYLDKTDEQAIAAFERRASSFGRDCLRQAFWRLSASPEQFFGLRGNLATSLSVMSVAQWVVGVGDRHLDNMLVSTRTGHVLGIDFGIAFGFATQFTPLPELIPFRLTPQLVGVLSPLNESGWLKQTMVHCLRALREDPSVLVSMLEVFVTEPCLDWVQQARRLAREQGGDTAIQWYVQSKMTAVRDKLDGQNPVQGLETDLCPGRVQDPCLERQLAVLRGAQSRVRARMPRAGLSPEQQVDCLLDLATDPLVLSFTYVGWCPWL